MVNKTKSKADQLAIKTKTDKPSLAKVLPDREEIISADLSASVTPKALQAEQNMETSPPVMPVHAGEAENNMFDLEGELVVDVFETNSDFVILTAIAGADIKDLDISVEKDMMIIRGQRTDPHHNPEKKYFYKECYWGPFSRKIILPENINAQAAHAQMHKGVLTIKIPKIDSKTS